MTVREQLDNCHIQIFCPQCDHEMIHVGTWDDRWLCGECEYQELTSPEYSTIAGHVACDYTQGDRLDDVRHGAIRETEAEAQADAAIGEYEGVRYVHTDGYLYVDEVSQ